MTPSCFCLRRCVLYCPVEHIPLSRDEQPDMREAQYHSGANSFQPTAAPTQLDPGQLDASRRSARVVRGASGGANSLLKQAIANRLKPCPESSMTSSGEATSKEDEPMNRSIVGNAAWYRDDEGRTGFKPKEWENLPNQQKEVVKSRRRRERQKSGETVETIDDELLKEDSSESKKEAEDDSKEADEEKKEGTKMTKEEKKELKRKEKEEKKREKEEKKKEKEEKKRLEKEEKKRRSTASLDKASEEGADDKKEERKETKEEKKERKRKEKEEKKRSGSSASLDKEDGLKAKSQGEEKKTKEAEEEERKRKERHEQRRREKSEERKRETETRKKKEESPMIRRESESSVASSSKSTDTVKKAPVIHSPRKPPRPPPKEILGSPHSSSTEEERVGRTVAAHKQPKKTDIGERRDSSLSESSRISGVSHKSVTFSDKVQMHEIERIQMSSSEDDVAVMSDDEMSKPDSERRRRLVKLLQSQQEQEYSDEDEEVEIEEEDDFEEQERLIEQQMYPVYNLEETGSHGSFYPEELDPDRYLLDDDGSYISLDKLPASVRRAIAMEMKARAEENNMGSMSKLHEQGSPLLGYQLPRSASGYLDDTYMVASYQQAMYGAFHPDDGGVYRSPKEERINRDERRNLHESFYDNVPSGSNSGQQREPSGASLEVTPVPSPPRKSSSTSIDRRAFFEDTGSSTPSPPRVVVTQTPGTPQKVTVTTTTTSTLMTNRTEILEREERMRKGKEKDEDEMKRKFVAKFGARKAPMAEEDPLDPGPTNGSQESLYSTDSRESVVSEVSIRRENLVRRNFNY